MLGRRRRGRATDNPPFGQRVVFAGDTPGITHVIYGWKPI